jgi:xanthine dehydrogenase accessory factor
VGLPVTVIARGADSQRFADAGQLIDSDEPATVAGQVAAGSWVVVATQGRRDLQGLRVALSLQAVKIWLVASARKAQALREELLATQYDPQSVSAIIAPAGQPIGAQTPEEIALAVLAAVVAARRAGRATPPLESTAAAGSAACDAASTPKCCGH